MDIGKIYKQSNLRQMLCLWQIKRAQRLLIEREFLDFTGRIDLVELHIPYTKYEYVFDMMKETQKDKATKRRGLISVGDSVNFDMFSMFYKRSFDRSTPSDEIDKLIGLLRAAEEVYDWVMFMPTNHEERMFKVLLNRIPEREVSDQVLRRIKTLKDTFEKEKLKKTIYLPQFLFQLGDAVIAHFENNSVVPSKIPRDIIQYLIPRIKRNWNICFQAHTHAQSMNSFDRKHVIETGASCETMDYWRWGRMKGKGKMATIGNAVCIMKDGKADINNCHYVVRGWEGYL